MPRHVRKGDTVVVTAGDNKGRTGVISRVIPDEDRVIVQGVNLRTRHMRPTQANPRGGVITKEAPLHISNVSPVIDGRASRVRFETKADGSKVRVAATTGKELGVVRGAGAGKPSSGAPAAKPTSPSKKKTKKKAASTKKKTAKKPAAKKSGAGKKTAKKKTSKKTTKKK